MISAMGYFVQGNSPLLGYKLPEGLYLSCSVLFQCIEWDPTPGNLLLFERKMRSFTGIMEVIMSSVQCCKNYKG